MIAMPLERNDRGRIVWPDGIEVILRRWDEEGLTLEAQGELLGVSAGAINDRRRRLGLGRRGAFFPWGLPEVRDLMERHYGRKPTPWLRERLAELGGHAPAINRIHQQAGYWGLEAAAPDDAVNLRTLGTLIGVSPCTLKAQARRLKIPLTGRGYCRLIAPRDAAVLFALYGAPLPWPPKRETWLGREVRAVIGVRARRAERYGLTVLVPKRDARPSFPRFSLVGQVVAEGPSYVDVSTPFGTVRAALPLVEPVEPEPPLIPRWIVRWPWQDPA